MGKGAERNAGKLLKEAYSAMQIQWAKKDITFVKVLNFSPYFGVPQSILAPEL